MERLVWSVFKAIILSMIFMVVWQLGFYLYNVSTLDQRMSNIMVSLEKTISENNYLPHEEAVMYANIFNAMQTAFMQLGDADRSDTDTNEYNGFIAGWSWNCTDGGVYQAFTPAAAICPANVAGGGAGGYDMAIPMNYGSVACIHIEFQINAPWVGFGHANEPVRTNGTNAQMSEWHVESQQTHVEYTSYVPCLKYRKIT